MPVINWQENDEGRVLVWLISDGRTMALTAEGFKLSEALRQLADKLDESEADE